MQTTTTKTKYNNFKNINHVSMYRENVLQDFIKTQNINKQKVYKKKERKINEE